MERRHSPTAAPLLPLAAKPRELQKPELLNPSEAGAGSHCAAELRVEWQAGAARGVERKAAAVAALVTIADV